MATSGSGTTRRTTAIALSTVLTAALLATTASAARRPDLVVAQVSVPKPYAQPGQNLVVRDVVKNRGKKTAGTSKVHYRLSKDRTLGQSDTKVGQRRIARVGSGKKSVDSVKLKIPSTLQAGLFYVIACADATRMVAESNEKNNCRASPTRVLIDHGLRVAPNPLDVQRALSTEHAVEKDVAALVGGTLTTTGPDGTGFTLEIPPDALYGDTTITMTPVPSITGFDPYVEAVGAAVELKPHGLRLYEPATLTIDPAGAAGRGSTFDRSGENFRLYPLVPGEATDSTAAVFNLYHFSAYGLVEGADADALAELTPESLEAQGESEVADIVERYRTSGDHDRFLAEFSDVMVRQYFRAVLPSLAVAQSGEADHANGLEALDVFNRWKLEVELVGLDDYFNERYRVNLRTLIDYGLKQLEGIAKTLFDKAWGRCRKGVERTKNLDIMTSWARIVEISLSGGAKVLGEDWQEKVFRCADPNWVTGQIRFESIWDATVSQPGLTKTIHSETTGTVHASFSKGPLTLDGRQQWIDEGTTVTGSYTMHADGEHDYGSTQCAFTEDQNFDVSGTVSDLEHGSASLVFDPLYPYSYTDNASLSIGARPIEDFTHQDATGPPDCGHDNGVTQVDTLFQSPVCPIPPPGGPPPDRPGPGMRGVFSQAGGVVTLDFNCSGKTTYTSTTTEGTEEYTTSGKLTFGAPTS